MGLSQIDSEGFIRDPTAWDKQYAIDMAEGLAIRLTDEHWTVIHAARKFYLNTGVSPSMRPLVNLAKQADPRLGSSLVLAKLFTSNTSKVVAQLSGTPKPSDCV